MATITKFTIIKGEDLTFNIIVKENGTVQPLQLSDTDTFNFTLVNKKTNEVYINNIPMSIIDALNGKVQGVIPAASTLVLPSKFSAAEDYYMIRPNLRLIVNGYSSIQGTMTAFIDNVYVVEG